jgi:hypothetical protein
VGWQRSPGWRDPRCRSSRTSRRGHLPPGLVNALVEVVVEQNVHEPPRSPNSSLFSPTASRAGATTRVQRPRRCWMQLFLSAAERRLASGPISARLPGILRTGTVVRWDDSYVAHCLSVTGHRAEASVAAGTDRLAVLVHRPALAAALAWRVRPHEGIIPSRRAVVILDGSDAELRASNGP